MQTTEYTGRQKGFSKGKGQHSVNDNDGVSTQYSTMLNNPMNFGISVAIHEPLPMKGGPTNPTSMADIKPSDGGREDSDEYHLPYDTIVDQQTRIKERRGSVIAQRHDGNISMLNWSGRDRQQQDDYLNERQQERDQRRIDYINAHYFELYYD
jgi:hypothetical protein